jgi:hypothetical protein
LEAADFGGKNEQFVPKDGFLAVKVRLTGEIVTVKSNRRREQQVDFSEPVFICFSLEFGS